MKFTFCLITFALFYASGCGADFKTVRVSGILTLDNQPVAGAGVVYVPEQPGPTASATTDAQGRYTLMTGKLVGAAPGKYRISVFKEETSGIKVGDDGLEAAAGRVTVKLAVPASYANPETSKLSMNIEAERSDADLKMTSKNK